MSVPQRPSLSMDYFPDIQRGLKPYASISDALRAQNMRGNTAFLIPQKGILRQKFVEQPFTQSGIKGSLHEMIHIFGELPHLPLFEEFVLVAEGSANRLKHPLKIGILAARAVVLDFRGSGCIYEKVKDMKRRVIKDWEMVYAGALGFWFARRCAEYMKAAQDMTGGHGFAALDKEQRRALALRLQKKSLFNKKIVKPVDMSLIEDYADHLPAELLYMSRTENRILLTIAKNGLQEYRKSMKTDKNGVLRGVVPDLPAEARPFYGRIKATLKYMAHVVYEAPYLPKNEEKLSFLTLHLRMCKLDAKSKEKQEKEAQKTAYTGGPSVQTVSRHL